MLSPNVPQGPRNPNGYTEEEILRAIRGLDGYRHLTFRYELLDEDMNYVRDLENVLEGSVQMSYISDIKRTATLTIQDEGDIDYLMNQVKPYVRYWLPARWVPETKIPHSQWANSFSASVEEPVTVANSDSYGSPFASVTGSVQYVFDPRINSAASVELGDATGVYASVSSTTIDSERSEQRFKTYLRFQEGVKASVVWLDSDGADLETGISIDGVSDTLELSGDDVTASTYANVTDRWVRFEADFNTTDSTVTYRLYWGNPYGAVADFEHSTTIGFNSPLGGFRVERVADTVTNPTTVFYLGPTDVGDLVTIPARPNRTDNDYVEFPLGVFLMSTPVATHDEHGVVTREIECYDRTKLFIDDKLTERLTMFKGQNYTDFMIQLLGNVPKIVEPSTWVCGRTRDWDVGTSIKEVIDACAESINYHTLRFDEEGRAILQPYVSPEDRTPEFTYQDDELSIMSPEVEDEYDYFEIPNVWIVSLSELDQDPIFAKIENNDPASRFSIPRRGRKIVDFRSEEEGFDAASLVRKAKRIQFEANRQYQNISFSTAINPLHEANDCYNIKFAGLALDNKYTEINWEFNLTAGAEMTHTARRVVEIDPELFTGFVEDHLQVNGCLTAGNIAWGTATFTPSKKNYPVSTTVTGLSLAGTGKVLAQATPVTTNSSHLFNRLVGWSASDAKETRVKLWVYTKTTDSVSINWMLMRNV